LSFTVITACAIMSLLLEVLKQQVKKLWFYNTTQNLQHQSISFNSHFASTFLSINDIQHQQIPANNNTTGNFHFHFLATSIN